MRILDLAAEKDPHTSIRGDVQLMTGILDRHDQRMQQVFKIHIFLVGQRVYI